MIVQRRRKPPRADMPADAFVDADVIVRLLTGDDPRKQARAAALFERVEAGEARLRLLTSTLADVVYVLTSPRLYATPRAKTADLLSVLVRLPDVVMDDREIALGALDLFARSNLDFGDALIAAAMAREGVDALYSYDRDYDRLAGMRRIEP
jgi:predicted nucleic acid-binding protein